MESKRLYFDTEEERDEYNREAARTRGCDMVTTIFWWPYGEDENGFYVEES
jgi:hypothetical protein